MEKRNSVSSVIKWSMNHKMQTCLNFSFITMYFLYFPHHRFMVQAFFYQALSDFLKQIFLKSSSENLEFLIYRHRLSCRFLDKKGGAGRLWMIWWKFRIFWESLWELTTHNFWKLLKNQ